MSNNVFPPVESDLVFKDLTQHQFEKLMPWQALRILLTPCLCISLLMLSRGSSEKTATFVLAVLLVILDIVDANPLIRLKGGVETESGSYQYADKMIDQAQYAAALVIIVSAGWRWPGDPANAQGKTALLLIAWTWRMLGVAQLMRTGELKTLTWFPDIFKELLVLWCILPDANPAIVTLVVGAKMVFEHLKADNKLDLLKLFKKSQ